MAVIKLKGAVTHTSGSLPEVGSTLPHFLLTKTDLSDVKRSDFAGKRLVLNIFPSIDTAVCAASVRQFNKAASSLETTTVLCISEDLPFAHARFCGAEGLNDVVSLSAFRSRNFGKDFGVSIVDGPLAGLFARAVVIVGVDGKVLYNEQVPEITQEPDYAAALKVLQ